MTVANVSTIKISTISRQCHPAAITQMVMDGLHCPQGDTTRSKRGQRPRLLVVCMLSLFPSSPAALSLLYKNYMTELLSGVTDKAKAAGYHVKFDFLPSGVAVQFSGYSDPDVMMRFMTDVLSSKWKDS